MPCCSVRVLTVTAASCVIEGLWAQAPPHGVPCEGASTPAPAERTWFGVTTAFEPGCRCMRHQRDGETDRTGGAGAVDRASRGWRQELACNHHLTDISTSPVPEMFPGHAGIVGSPVHVATPGKDGAVGCNRSCSGMQPSTAASRAAACMSADALG